VFRVAPRKAHSAKFSAVDASKKSRPRDGSSTRGRGFGIDGYVITVEAAIGAGFLVDRTGPVSNLAWPSGLRPRTGTMMGARPGGF
jgi:hypothetical protein